MNLCLKCYYVERGYCTKSTPTMSAGNDNAMPEAACLRMSQQRIVKKFLTLHLGRRIVESEKN